MGEAAPVKGVRHRTPNILTWVLVAWLVVIAALIILEATT
jgi:hypothetical protein